MNTRRFLLFAALLLMVAAAGFFFLFRGAENYAQRPAALEFATRMSTVHGFQPEEILRAFAGVRRQSSALAAMARPAEKHRSWEQYGRLFLQEERLVDGAVFWHTHRRDLERAADVFGIPPEIIVSIIGVESHYGRNTGKYRALDVLTSLAFDYPQRAAFFRDQLMEYFLLVRELGLEPRSLKSSYAGAMGYGQFIPGSYRRYAVDFDGDGTADLLGNPVDAIGSIGNYLEQHGWQSGARVLAPARATGNFARELVNRSLQPELRISELWGRGFFAVPPAPPAEERAVVLAFHSADGTQYWFGLHNFYVLTRYNPSRLYAMAVYQLARQLRLRVEAGAPGAEEGPGNGGVDAAAAPGPAF